MKYVGIDLHTNRFTCCYLFDDSKEKQMETFELDHDGLRKFYSTINKDTYIRQSTKIHMSLLKRQLTLLLLYLCSKIW